MKKTKTPREPAIPVPPPWAQREIKKLTRDSGMVTERLYAMVLRNGIEATRNLLEEQIQLIASIDNGPIEQTNELPLEPAADTIEELDKPVSLVNGTHGPENNGTGIGPDNVSERRAEPGESKPDDFLAELVPRPSGTVTEG